MSARETCSNSFVITSMSNSRAAGKLSSSAVNAALARYASPSIAAMYSQPVSQRRVMPSAIAIPWESSARFIMSTPLSNSISASANRFTGPGILSVNETTGRLCFFIRPCCAAMRASRAASIAPSCTSAPSNSAAFIIQARFRHTAPLFVL